MENLKSKTSSDFEKRIMEPMGRRKFFFFGAAALSTAALVTGCKKDDDETPATPGNPADGVDLGSGDPGILNYAYALEQLEAAFYLQVAATPYSGISNSELSILNDIRDHEVAHRDFFKAALGSGAIQNLEVNFSSIDFSSRASVLGTAKVFEDLGVSAYNGAGKLLVSPDYLLLAGKIVSVEARHASVIRDLLNPNSTDFAGDDTINANGLDVARMPSEVLAAAAPFIKTKINASNLPTS